MLEWQLSPEVHSAGVHETTDQQLGGCSPEEGPPTFPFLMTDISGVKGRSLVLQAEPKSLQILPKDRDFFFFLQSIHLPSFSTMDMFLYVLPKLLDLSLFVFVDICIDLTSCKMQRNETELSQVIQTNICLSL